MTETGQQILKSRVILFRSGGLGDILLTFPLLETLSAEFDELIVSTPSKYHFLIKEFSSTPSLYDMDEGDEQVMKLAYGAEVLSFWKDPNWMREWQSAGAKKVRSFNPRPVDGGHFSCSLLNQFVSSTDRQKLNRLWLRKEVHSKNITAQNLWIHPGSGSLSKNLSLSEFIYFADHWLKQNPEVRVFFSFGEADLKLEQEFSEHPFSRNENVDYKIFSSLKDLYYNLQMHSGSFAGNDSGPSHMAAMLGIDTHVWFCSTNPEVWAPLGPSVKIYHRESVPSKIL